MGPLSLFFSSFFLSGGRGEVKTNYGYYESVKIKKKITGRCFVGYEDNVQESIFLGGTMVK